MLQELGHILLMRLGVIYFRGSSIICHDEIGHGGAQFSRQVRAIVLAL